MMMMMKLLVLFEVNDESEVEFEADTKVGEDSVFDDEG